MGAGTRNTSRRLLVNGQLIENRELDPDRDICSKYRQSYIIVRLFLEHLHMRTEYTITYTVRNIILAIWKDACCLRVQLNLGSCIARKRSSFIVRQNCVK